MNDEKKKKELFQEGLRQYKLMDYFQSHEVWEELWSDYYLKDKKFIQGLIQLSVSFVHLGNGNLIGANNLLKKSEEKFTQFSGIHRGIDIKTLLNQIKNVELEYKKLKNPDNFQWDLVPKLEQE
jgi:predicted metal-dependent hydrolase